MIATVQEQSFGLVWAEEPLSKVKIHAAKPADLDTVTKAVEAFNKHTNLVQFSFEELPKTWQTDRRFTSTETEVTSFKDKVRGDRSATLTCGPNEEDFIQYLIETTCSSLYKEAKEKKMAPPFTNNPIFFMAYLKEHFSKTSEELEKYYIPLITFFNESPIDEARLEVIADQLKTQIYEEETIYEEDLPLFTSYIALLAPHLNIHLIANKIEGKELPAWCVIS